MPPAAAPTTPPRLAWLAAPLPAALLGAWAARRHELPVRLIALQLAAACVALAAAWRLAHARRDRLLRASRATALAGLAALAATLATAGVDGVRRWLPLGPVRVCVSALVAPWVLVAAAAFLGGGRAVAAGGVLLGAQLVHLAQPDAGQASALALGACALIALHRPARAAAVVLAAACAALAALTWARPDPLSAVAHVEGAVSFAAAAGAPVALVLATLALLPAASAHVVMRAAPDTARASALALGAYLLGTVLVGTLANYPVPVLGWGVSPVLGTWTAVALVIALAR